MTFKPGDPRPEGAGRKPGQVNRATADAREQTRKAIEIACAPGQIDLMTIQVMSARLMFMVGLSFLPAGATENAVAFQAAVKTAKPADLQLALKFLATSSEIAHGASDWVYAKQARVDMKVAGDPDNPLVVESTEAERFARKIAGLAARSGARLISGEPVGEGEA